MAQRSVCVGAVLAASGCLAGSAAGQASFTGLGDLPGGAFLSQARGVSADGSVVVGNSTSGLGTEGFRWTASGGMVALSDLAGGSVGATALGAANDGTAFGSGTDATTFRQAARWAGGSTAAAGLGYAATGGYDSVLNASSADGSAACGDNLFAPTSSGGPPPLPIGQAVRWTAATGMVNLGSLPGVTPAPGSTASAKAISADGSVVVGSAQDGGFVNHPFRWTAATGMVDLSQGQWTGIARGVSPDGMTVAGSRTVGGVSVPFVWTQAEGVSDPGLLAGFNSGGAFDVGASGRLCGTMLVSGVSGSNAAAVWDVGLGWRSLGAALAAAGAPATGWTLQFATSMSDDGRVIVGYGLNPSGQTEAFRAVLPLPCRADFNGSGAVTVQDIFDFLGAYFGNQASADFNQSGAVSVQDIFDFLAAYFVGC